jgi:hypothetical protein
MFQPQPENELIFYLIKKKPMAIII